MYSFERGSNYMLGIMNGISDSFSNKDILLSLVNKNTVSNRNFLPYILDLGLDGLQ